MDIVTFRRTLAVLEILIVASCLSASAGDMPNYTSRLYPGPDGRLVYIPDERGNTIPDFSHAGYGGGGVVIPYVPVKETLWPVEGDNTPLTQAAVDRVSKMLPHAGGFRGAVLLKRGYFVLNSPIRIKAGGVVLRGEGQGETGTILMGTGTVTATGPDSPALIDIGGMSSWDEVSGSAARITDEYVPVGARVFHVENAGRFKPGDTVLVRRHGNQAWIDTLGMNLENRDWRWDPFTISFDRVVTGVGKDTVTVDAPVVCAIESRWGGGEVVKYTDRGRISQSGIENLRGMSDFDHGVRTNNYGNIDRQPYIGEEYYADEKHYWNFISLDNIKNAWVRNVTALHFAGSMVRVGPGSKWVTVEDCISLEPVSIRAGGRRFTYQIQGQLTLVHRCRSDRGRHSFVLSGYQACGPNVFLDCTATVPYSSSEPHFKFVTGALYDNVTAPLTARFWKLISIGWAGANCVFWNCDGQYLIQKPPAAQNYAFGHIGIHATVFNTYYQDLTKEDGYIESWDRHVDPGSLYLKQLEDRLGSGAFENIGYERGVRGR